MDDEAVLVASEVLLAAAGIAALVLILATAIRAPRRRVLVPAVAAAVAIGSVVLGSVLPSGSAAAVEVSQGFFVALPVLLATFPDGRFVPRWTIWLLPLYPAVLVADALAGGRLSDRPWWWIVPSSMFLLVGTLVYRYRASATTLEREQIRWLVLGTLVTVGLFQVLIFTDAGVAGTGAASEARATLAMLPLIAGVTIAFARPRLANVDAALRFVLAVFLAGIALAAVFWIAWWLTREMTDPAMRALTSALAVAVAAYPVILAALRLATLVVFRRRLRPAAAVARLGVVLAEQPDARSAPAALADVVVEALAVPWARIGSEEAPLNATSGEVPALAEGVTAVAVAYQGERLADIVVPPRRGESELSRADRDTLAQLALHAGPALHGARALAELADTHARVLGAREEERRRLRRELHDDLGPALSGLALGAAAIAKRSESGSAEVAASARELQSDIADAVARAREISHGLRPPILDDRGLEAALRDRMGAGVELRIGDLGALPAAVDLAALRIVQEAVTNVRRHAQANACTVRVDRDGTGLLVEVVDDGIGIPRAPGDGLGLRSIRERAVELGGRARVRRRAEGGTVVTVWLPIGGMS